MNEAEQAFKSSINKAARQFKQLVGTRRISSQRKKEYVLRAAKKNDLMHDGQVDDFVAQSIRDVAELMFRAKPQSEIDAALNDAWLSHEAHH